MKPDAAAMARRRPTRAVGTVPVKPEIASAMDVASRSVPTICHDACRPQLPEREFSTVFHAVRQQRNNDLSECRESLKRQEAMRTTMFNRTCVRHYMRDVTASAFPQTEPSNEAVLITAHLAHRFVTEVVQCARALADAQGWVGALRKEHLEEACRRVLASHVCLSNLTTM